MKRRLIKAIKGESGQALPIVLVLLLLGGLLIAPTLSYAATSLNAGRIVEKNVNGLYAADAGVEYVLWQITNSIPPLEQQPLPQDVNLMAVNIQTDIIGTYTLYFGDLIVVGEPPQNFPEYLAVDGEMVLVDEELQVYQYTITVTWQAEAGSRVIGLVEVGVRLPVGYSYQSGSAAGMSPLDPYPIEQDAADAYMLVWGFGTPYPYVSNPDSPNGVLSRTQIFYVTGAGEPEGDYTWVKARDPDIGQVGEVSGKLYRITARATIPGDGEIIAEVVADAMLYEGTGEITILLWQINPE